MAVPDETLTFALSDASEGQGILVITKDAAETHSAVTRARSLLIRHLCMYAGATRETAMAFILESRNAWKMDLRSGGWVFFYPEMDLKATDDVGGPVYVYSRDNKGRYEKLYYRTWKSRQPIPPEPTPAEIEVWPVDPEAAPKQTGRSSWAHLTEDDDA